MWKTKKRRCINKYTISDKWAQMIANYLFDIYLKLMESNINDLKENNIKIEKKYEWLKDFAELTDSASLFKLYENFNKWQIINKENLDLIWNFIISVNYNDIFKFIEKYQDSTIRYFKVWVKLSNFFPYSKYSVYSFTEKYFDNFVNKLEDEERNRIWLFFTFIWVFIGFLALIKLSNSSIYLKFYIFFILIFIVVLFIKELLFLWKNISRKKMLLNLSRFLEDENNINKDFLKFILEYYKKIMEYEKRNRQNNLNLIKQDLDFFLIDSKFLFYLKSIFKVHLKFNARI